MLFCPPPHHCRGILRGFFCSPVLMAQQTGGPLYANLVFLGLNFAIAGALHWEVSETPQHSTDLPIRVP
jgi:hypothetical protein